MPTRSTLLNHVHCSVQICVELKAYSDYLNDTTRGAWVYQKANFNIFKKKRMIHIKILTI